MTSKDGGFESVFERSQVLFEQRDSGVEVVLGNVHSADPCRGPFASPRPRYGAGMFLGEQQGNDAGARAGFEYPVPGLDAAKIGEQQAVEIESGAFFLLHDRHNAGAAKGNAVF